MAFSDSASLALALALVLAAYGAVALVATGVSPSPSRRLRASGYRAAFATAGLVTYSSLVLAGLLAGRDFSVAYVAEVANRAMSFDQLLSAFWGGQPGSLLLWAWALSLVTAAVVLLHRRGNPGLTPGVVGTLLAVECFFLLVLTLAASPFEKLPAPRADGQGLNPLLLDPAMRIHPPLVLSGYMSFSVPFAFAMGALITGRVGLEWVRAVRGWTLLAWTIQATGLIVGAWWAYHVLGWGGYWGWDPVENVALLPWLASTALLHSLMVQERRGMLKVWNLGLVVATFGLSIFGTFVVRSGIITSVHSFATSSVGPYFFAFLGVVLLVAIGLIAYRLPSLAAEHAIDSVVSRESAFLLNNLLLVALVAVTFWGTIFPMVSETVRGAKIAVGPAYYRQVDGPLLLALLALMALGPMLGWRRSSLPRLLDDARWPLAVTAAVGVAALVLGAGGLASVAIAACVLVVGAIAVEYGRGLRARRKAGEPLVSALVALVARDRRRYGGYLVHLAMVVIAVGIVGSSGYQQVGEATIAPGQSLTVGGYSLVNGGVSSVERAGMAGVTGTVGLRRGGRSLGVLRPERRIYAGWEKQPVTGVAIQTVLPRLDDVYVLMTNLDASGAMSLRVFVNPLVALLWVGALLFLVATAITAWPAGPVRAPGAARIPAREAATSDV